MITSCGMDQLPAADLARVLDDAGGVGTVRSSSAGENGTGTSMAPMRMTGASR
jgi:hypothetical protein